MKNASRNKFLLCFRPVVDMDLVLESKAVMVDRSQNQAFTAYVGVKNKEDMKPSKTKASVSDAENSIVIHRPGKKTFSQVIKAVVFETVLAKRVRERKGIDQRSYSSKPNFELSYRGCDKFDASGGKSVSKVLAGRGIQHTLSKSDSISSLSYCSSLTSASSSSSSPNTTQKPKSQKLQNNDDTCRNHQQREMKPKQERSDGGSSGKSAIFLLVVSLAVTIFWGKIWAIFFTSIWLYFLPQQQQPAGVIGNLESPGRSPEKKSREYKKKVIMEGLLDRNYNRGA